MFRPYETEPYFDEMLKNNEPKPHYKSFCNKLMEFSEN